MFRFVPRLLLRLFPDYVTTSTRTCGERPGSARPARTICAGSDGSRRSSPSQRRDRRVPEPRHRGATDTEPMMGGATKHRQTNKKLSETNVVPCLVQGLSFFGYLDNNRRHLDLSHLLIRRRVKTEKRIRGSSLGDEVEPQRVF